MKKTALVLITEGSEDLEAVTVIDVLRRGGIKVTVSAIVNKDKVVHCANGINILADELLSETLDKKTEFDALVLPGGSLAADTYSKNQHVQGLIKAFEADGKLVAVICASTLAIHAAGAFKGRKATSYPSLRAKVEDLYEYQEASVVVDGNLITSRGPATAMAFALTIVDHLAGKPKRDSVASGLLFA